MRTGSIVMLLGTALALAFPTGAAGEISLPSDTYFCGQWNFHNNGGNCDGAAVGKHDADVDAVEAWDIMQGAVNAAPSVIAFLDNGIFYSQPDLVDNMWINKPEDKSRVELDCPVPVVEQPAGSPAGLALAGLTANGNAPEELSSLAGGDERSELGLYGDEARGTHTEADRRLH